MKKLIYKGIEFSDFRLYKEADNSSGCEYDYPHTVQSTDGFEEANVYVCPQCIKKYELYAETETTREEVEDIIQNAIEGDYPDISCGVKGCCNKNGFDGIFDIDSCHLEDNEEDDDGEDGEDEDDKGKSAEQTSKRKPIDMSNFYDVALLYGFPVLTTPKRIDKESLPQGLYLYELRHDDTGDICEVKETVACDFHSSIICGKHLHNKLSRLCGGIDIYEDQFQVLDIRMAPNEYLNYCEGEVGGEKKVNKYEVVFFGRVFLEAPDSFTARDKVLEGMDGVESTYTEVQIESCKRVSDFTMPHEDLSKYGCKILANNTKEDVGTFNNNRYKSQKEYKIISNTTKKSEK